MFKILTTVGSTKFEELTEAICSQKFLSLIDESFNSDFKLLVQVGHASGFPHLGDAVDKENEHGLLDWWVCANTETRVKHIRYSSSMSQFIASADLVICHGGSGTLLEALTAPKARILAVSNHHLMSDHQVEIGVALSMRGSLTFMRGQDLVEIGGLEHFLKLVKLVIEEPIPPKVIRSGEGNDTLCLRPFYDVIEEELGCAVVNQNIQGRSCHY